MRPWLLAAALSLSLLRPAEAAISYVTTSEGGACPTTPTTCAVVLASVTAGQLLYVYAEGSPSNLVISSVTDSLGTPTVYAAAYDQVGDWCGGNCQWREFYGVATTSGSNITVTVTFGAGVTYSYIRVAQYSASVGSIKFQSAAAAVGNSSSYGSGALTTYLTALRVGTVVTSQTPSDTSGWTRRFSGSGRFMDDLISSVAGTYNFTASQSPTGRWGASIAAFREYTGAATINAPTCSQADVVAAIGSAVDGDTVLIPAGTCSWTSTVNLSKAIRLLGSGQGVTVIQNNTSDGSGPPGTFLAVSVAAAAKVRVSGFTVTTSWSGARSSLALGTITLNCASPGGYARIDHVTFTTPAQVGVVWTGMCFGLMDQGTSTVNFTFLTQVWHPTWVGGADFGDGSWSAATNLGTIQAVYIEDWTHTDTSNAIGTGIVDSFKGGRYVVRYSTIAGTNVASHGTESGQRQRGLRTFEIYRNAIHPISAGGGQGDTHAFGAYMRAGTGVVHHNTFGTASPATGYTNGVRLELDRVRDSFNPWGVCDGSGGYDNNDGGATPTVYASGTHTGANAATTLSVAGTPWSASQWIPAGAPYSIRNTTQGWGSEVNGNGTNTLTYQASAFGGNYIWNSGDGYEIRRATICIDQPGRGIGTSLSGATPSPTGWASDALEPIYMWSNTLNNVVAPISSSTGRLISGRDWNYSADASAAMPGYSEFTYPHTLRTDAFVGDGVTPPPPNIRGGLSLPMRK